MRIGSDSPDSTSTAGASAPAGKASPEGARATPARSGALAPLGARRSSSTSAPLQAGGDPKGKRLLEPSGADAVAPAAKRLRPTAAPPGGKPTTSGPLGEPASVPKQAPGKPKQTLAGAPKGSRQNTTAAAVYQILLERSKRGSTSTIARAVKVPEGTVGRWINEKRWQSGELLSTLTKMQDYAEHRDAIDALAKDMGLTSEDLPPPAAKQRGQMSSDLLKAALELMRAKQGENLVGRGRTPGMLSAVAGPLNLDRRTLGAWLTPTGAPAKPLDALARLPGYEQVRGDLQRLFSALGHREVADSLPLPGDSNATHKMTAALLVEALQKIKTDGGGSSAVIGAALGVQRTLIRQYIVLEDVSLRSPQLVRNLPDYAQHRDAIAVALAALGHEQQARDLPLPFVDAERFLNVLRNDMPRVVDAIKRMQSNPTLSPRDAAQAANVLPEAFTAVVDANGALRQRRDVYDALSTFGSHLMPGIDEELARLRATVSGKAPVAAAPREMARFELPAHGSIPGKVFIVRPSTGDPGPKAKNRLEKIYANNADLVRLPRSYETERPRQMLRWLSTVIKDRFPTAREIQCYFHAGSGQIVVASNTNEANAELEEFFATGGAEELAEHAEASSGAREARHAGKLRKSLANADTLTAGNSGAMPQDKVRAAIAAGRFRVPRTSFNERGSTIKLHAERRIQHYVRETFGELLDRRLLAGTMRPCGTCADELGLDDGERRGPFWLSRAGQAFADTPRIIERNIASGVGTFVTKTREGRVTTDHDTDSDSDLDDGEARTARSRG